MLSLIFLLLGRHHYHQHYYHHVNKYFAQQIQFFALPLRERAETSTHTCHCYSLLGNDSHFNGCRNRIADHTFPRWSHVATSVPWAVSLWVLQAENAKEVTLNPSAVSSPARTVKEASWWDGRAPGSPWLSNDSMVDRHLGGSPSSYWTSWVRNRPS